MPNAPTKYYNIAPAHFFWKQVYGNHELRLDGIRHLHKMSACFHDDRGPMPSNEQYFRTERWYRTWPDTYSAIVPLPHFI